MKTVRVAKSALVAGIGLYALLVGWNNLVDYGSNFEFVRHVLLMDTTFPENALRNRAIDSDGLHRVGYALIIGAEWLCALTCLAGAARLASRIRSSGAEFDRARGLAVAGLTLGFAIWFVGFIAVGGEWFLMWQSREWNGEEAAFRIVACILLVLIFLCQKTEPDS